MTIDEVIARLKECIAIDGIPYPPATEEEIEDAEELLDCDLPPSLWRLYAEVANGGFGPGNRGLLGLANGSSDDQGNTAVSYYKQWKFERPLDVAHSAWGPWREHLLPICHWGCSVFSCVDCSKTQAPIVRFHADQYDPGGSFRELFSPESPSIEEWLEAWLCGKSESKE